MAPNLVPFIVAPLIAFGIYRRVRGSFGRQPIRSRGMKIRVGLFALFAGLLLMSGFQDVRLAEGAVAGMALGGILAWFVGLRLTRFETSPEGGDFYIPNPWVGGALTLLLMGRLAWRFLVLAPVVEAGASAATNAPPPGMSPLTNVVIGLTLGYYAFYFAGVLIHHRRFKQLAQLA